MTSRRLFTMMALAAVACVAAALPVGAGPVASAGPWEKVSACAPCHPIIASAWEDSAHSRSAASPAFAAALGSLMGPGGDAAAGRGCLLCHAPESAAVAEGQVGSVDAGAGIGCDFCHTLAEVAGPPSRPGVPQFASDPGPLKRGPLAYTESPWHGTAFPPLFAAGAGLCVGCHEHVNAAGLALLTSWSEWSRGPWPARGVSCRDCHMAFEPGTPAERAVGGASQRQVSDHRCAGAGSHSRLHHALGLTLASVERIGPRLHVAVTVRNVGVGHSVPGGLPGSSLALVVGVTQGSGVTAQKERIYRRVVLDREGKILEDPAALFLDAVAEGPDTRLGPGEARTEQFDLDVPVGTTALVARLEYRDGSRAVRPRAVLISEIRKNVPP